MTSNIVQNPKSQLQSQTSDMNPMELALLGGDLSKLSEKDRANYYSKVCDSLGLNPLTWPFEYIRYDGKLKLYAKKDATEQLRKLNRVSIAKAELKIQDGLAIVEVLVTTPDGRSDCDIGAVPIAGLSGKDLSNALMKAVTKGKRRATLSICGLGWLDETEIDSIEPMQPQARKEVLPAVVTKPIEPKQLKPAANPAASNSVSDALHRLQWTKSQLETCLAVNFGKQAVVELDDENLLDFLDYLAVFEKTSAEIKRLGWDKQYGRTELKMQFGRETRSDLKFQELSEFLEFLKTQQPA